MRIAYTFKDNGPTLSEIKDRHLVRHGQSVDNAAAVFQSVNSPLSGKGIRQAEALAGRLSHLEFETLIASPVLRARQTAGHIVQTTGKEIEICELFVERVKPSGIDGRPWDDPAADKLFREWKETLFVHGSKRAADGENYDDLVARADKAISFLTARDEQSMVVVTHGFFLTVMVARILADRELSPPMLQTFHNRAMVENTSITVLRYLYDHHDGASAWRLWAFNDHSHFAE